MSFTSYSFFIFLPVVFALHWLCPSKFRWILLLISSLYFYMSWNAKYIVLILFTTLVSYFCGILLERAKSESAKKVYVALCLIASLGVLAVFKYANWLIVLISRVGNRIGIPMSEWTLSLLLPVGISFYTFQTLSYVIDVYRGKIPAEKNLGIYATYVTFFPQLVAGPIERSDVLLPQIKASRKFDYDQAVSGLAQMSWGFFKKILIADALVSYVDSIFGTLEEHTGLVLFFGALCFTFQIYCDFSGYSDIAIGTAKLFGINLSKNFNSPYYSQSVKEFWNRWHISLSTWFRDYVYIPCGGNRCSTWKQYRNLLITFLLSGLWHGAGSHFIVWGLLHGILQCVERAVRKKLPSFMKAGFVPMAGTFLLCVFAWVFFRAESVSSALWILRHMWDGITSPITYLQNGYAALGIPDIWDLIGLLLPIFLLACFDWINLKHDCIACIRGKPALVRWLFYMGISIPWVIAMIASYASNSTNSFIYFQF